MSERVKWSLDRFYLSVLESSIKKLIIKTKIKQYAKKM